MIGKKVTVIPANTSKNETADSGIGLRKRKVAAYARVSTELEEQESSFEAQVNYYTSYIRKNPDWDFVEVYADEGLSGTRIKKRVGFQRMIKDAKDGKIDLILTKSISRFARNTVDSLTTIRELKEKGVEVYFEKENIWTLDAKSEVIITIMSSIAQEESRSISENVAWGHRRAFAEGKRTCATNLYGYRKGADGKVEIDEEKADEVRHVFMLYNSGFSFHWIAADLNARGVKTAAGGKKWDASSIRRMITNEKYTGNAILQKTFTVDFLSHKRKINRGELPQYYIEGGHPAIISQETFDRANNRIESGEVSTRRGHMFSGKIFCGICGNKYFRKKRNCGTKYEKVYWVCGTKHSRALSCRDSVNLTDDDVTQLFVSAINTLFREKEKVIKAARAVVDRAFPNNDLLRKRQELEDAITDKEDLLNVLTEKNKTEAQDQEKYRRMYKRAESEHAILKAELQEAEKDIEENNAARAKVLYFIEALEGQESLVTELTPALFSSLITKMVVYSGSDIRVLFRDGTEICPVFSKTKKSSN